MTPDILHPLIFGWLLALSPPERDAVRPTYVEAVETVDERTVRYMDISKDVTAAVGDLPAGARKGAAQLLIAIAWHESGFAKDVDLGPCAPGRLRIGGCDHGRARGLWQVQAYDWGHRQEAAALAMRLAFRSMTACKKLPPEEQLAAYTGGTCASKMGRFRSREIWAVLKRIRAMPSKLSPPAGLGSAEERAGASEVCAGSSVGLPGIKHLHDVKPLR